MEIHKVDIAPLETRSAVSLKQKARLTFNELAIATEIDEAFQKQSHRFGVVAQTALITKGMRASQTEKLKN